MTNDDISRVAVFVDVQNIYYTTRQAFGRQFDYRKFWARIEQESDIVVAQAYAIARNESRQLRFQAALRHIGFTVKLKPWIQRSDGSSKGDWDVGITIDILDVADRVDRVVLLSGDGDFDLLLTRIRAEHSLSAEVYGVEPLTAQSLINAASVFHPIDEALLI